MKTHLIKSAYVALTFFTLLSMASFSQDMLMEAPKGFDIANPDAKKGKIKLISYNFL
jgi:hypothetical protein